MEGLDTLTRFLARRTPEQLAALLTRHAEPLSRRPAATQLRGLAAALWSYEALHHLVLHLDHPRLKVLATAAGLSQAAARSGAAGPAAPAPGADYQSLMAHRLSFPDLATAPVPVEEIHAALGTDAPGPARDCAAAALHDLCEDGLAAVTEDGHIVVPPRAPQLLAAHDLGPFTPAAPCPAPHPDQADAAALRSEAQAAATAFAAAVDRLLAALAEQPAALRKTGGLAVREIKRLAKASGASEPHTRLLLDLGLAAGLIALTRTPSGTTALPTGAYDQWLDLSPAERLAPVLAAWAGLWSIPTHTPFGQTPTALVRGEDRYAPALRHALLAALADLPAGTGTPLPAPGAPTLTALDPVLDSAAWHRPLALADQPLSHERAAHTLQEAAFLGLVAHDTLTPLGHALLAAAPDDPAALAAPLRDILPPPLQQALFQTDLTAVVPGAPSAALTGLLALAADRESEDQAITWRFTPASVRRALDAGHTPDTLLADLAAASATGPLPHPLTYLIKDTARTHGRVRVVRTACCIRSDDEALVRELVAHHALRPLGLRAVAPTVLISAQDPDATLAALRAAGYAPVLEAESGTTLIERTPSHRTQAPTPGRRPSDHLALARRLLDQHA